MYTSKISIIYSLFRLVNYTMTNLYTDISWQLSDYCKAECSYCPIQFRGGSYPPENYNYDKITELLVNHYNNKLNRLIRWNFDGGEPLDLHNLVRVLIKAKGDNNSVTLHTNGGQLWMDWWAVEPAIDNLILTYHYWQNPSLINYIIDIFKKKNKPITLKMPVRPDHFEEDMKRIYTVEEQKEIKATKVILYKNASRNGGMFPYSEEQLNIISGIKVDKNNKTSSSDKPISDIVKEKRDFESKTYTQKLEEKIKTNPNYFGIRCNVGIEKLIISYNGYVNGSNCRNQPLGNIWQEGWAPPIEPQVCVMQACIDPSDQKITKFTSQTQN